MYYGLRKRPTYESLLKVIEDDKDKLHYPNRRAKQFFDSFVFTQISNSLSNDALTSAALTQALTKTLAEKHGVDVGTMTDLLKSIGGRPVLRSPVDLKQGGGDQPDNPPPPPSHKRGRNDDPEAVEIREIAHPRLLLGGRDIPIQPIPHETINAAFQQMVNSSYQPHPHIHIVESSHKRLLNLTHPTQAADPHTQKEDEEAFKEESILAAKKRHGKFLKALANHLPSASTTGQLAGYTSAMMAKALYHGTRILGHGALSAANFAGGMASRAMQAVGGNNEEVSDDEARTGQTVQIGGSSSSHGYSHKEKQVKGGFGRRHQIQKRP